MTSTLTSVMTDHECTCCINKCLILTPYDTTLAPHMSPLLCLCMFACMHTSHILISIVPCCHGIVFSRTSKDLYDVQWHHAMINLDRRTFLVSEGRTTSSNPFNCACLNWSWMLSSINLFSCLTMLYHSLSWSTIGGISTPQISPRAGHSRASSASRSSWACCSTFVHSASWHKPHHYT